jgi:hypothetical protein
MRNRSLAQNKSAVAVWALDERLIAHFKVDPRMAERAISAVAGDACIVHFNDLGRFDGHGMNSCSRQRR